MVLNSFNFGIVTYEFDSMARGCRKRPGASLLAGIFVRPVGAGDGAGHTVYHMITSRCKKNKQKQSRMQNNDSCTSFPFLQHKHPLRSCCGKQAEHINCQNESKTKAALKQSYFPTQAINK